MTLEGIRTPEAEPELLFKITLKRHEKPYYKDIGHDLTPEGVEGSIESGKEFAKSTNMDEEDVILVHSPTARAKGTLDFFSEAAGLGDKPKHSIKHLRKSDMPGYDILKKWFEEVADIPDEIAKGHYHNPMFLEHPEIIETHEHKRQRLYRTFEHVIRWFSKNPSENKKPHVVAVSHFELITHVINDVFGIEEIGRYDSPSFGQSVNIEVFGSFNDERLKIRVRYEDREKDVYFNRKSRSIELE